VGIFRKKETYNEQMLREAGLDRVVFNTPPPPQEPEVESAYSSPPAEPAEHHGPPLIILGDGAHLHGGNPAGQPVWDVTTTATAPGVLGDHVAFTVLPSGDLIVETEDGDGDLSPLADAIEQHISPPYSAIASRQQGDLWGVGGKRIEVATIPYPDAETLVLSRNDGESEFRVDGAITDIAIPEELQRLGAASGSQCCVEARRIDGDDWEVKVRPL
jgi:hypothetical protein